MGYLRPYFPKMTSSSENRRKSVGKRRQGFGKGGQGKEEKKREGWVGDGQKKEGGVGRWVGDDVIKKIKKVKK